jgi:hypothetical protein
LVDRLIRTPQSRMQKSTAAMYQIFSGPTF